MSVSRADSALRCPFYQCPRESSVGSDPPIPQQRGSPAQSLGNGSHRGTGERAGLNGGAEDIDGFIHLFIDDCVGGKNRPALTPTQTVSAKETCGTSYSAPGSRGYDRDSGGNGGCGALRKDSDNGIVTKEQHLLSR